MGHASHVYNRYCAADDAFMSDGRMALICNDVYKLYVRETPTSSIKLQHPHALIECMRTK